MKFLQYETGCARGCSEVQKLTVSCLLKTCISDCVNYFTVMLSRCSKHSKLPQIFLVMSSRVIYDFQTVYQNTKRETHALS